MGLKEDLTSEVGSIFRSQWNEEVTTSVPDPKDLLLNSNHSKKLETAAVLYADIDGSTSMVDQYTWGFSAEVYKAYLRCASQIIKAEGGVITAYDGDRVMGIFMGNRPRTDAVRASLKINWAVDQIIRPAYTGVYPKLSSNFVLKHVIGIDVSEIHAARIGVHGDNDIVWVGGAANHAAKLCTQSAQPIWITKPVFDGMDKTVRYAQNGVGADMWSPYTWNSKSIFGTSYVWAI
jgi:class 3 adenylate cyclase